MGARDTIRFNALDLPEGQTRPYFCPFCQAPHENKLYVTRLGDKLAYQCKRASCGASGYVQSVKGQGGSTPKKVFEPRKFEVKTCGIKGELLEYLTKTYSIYPKTFQMVGAVQNLRGTELFFPVFRNGRKIGVVSKRIFGVGKKSDTWRFEEELMYYHLARGDSDQVWIVEGVLDALKIKQVLGHHAIALLGTHLHEEVKNYVASLRPKQVNVCLDPDAIKAQMKMVKDLRLTVPAKSIVLKKDPKDTLPTQLRRYA